MAYNDFPVNIPGRLKSAAVGGVVADAEDIYDDVLGKSQHTINSETEGRLDGQDTKIDRKLAEIDTKYEDFEERTDELFEQEKVDNRNAINEAVSSIRANDTIVVEDHTAVSTPEANKIYREYGETSYADWQYQNSAWVKLAEYNHGVDDEPTAGSDNLVKSSGVQNELALGAVYDVSAKNPTAGPNNDGKFESLSALLSDASLNALIPTAVRRGGMSIKFVQSSDNKYVQYRLMSNSFKVNLVYWQGIEDNPVEGSENLVKSGGILNDYFKRGGKFIIDSSDVDQGSISVVNGKTINTNANRVYLKSYFGIEEGKTYYLSSANTANVLYYNANKEFISTPYQYIASLCFTPPTNARYVRFTFEDADGLSPADFKGATIGSPESICVFDLKNSASSALPNINTETKKLEFPAAARLNHDSTEWISLTGLELSYDLGQYYTIGYLVFNKETKTLSIESGYNIGRDIVFGYIKSANNENRTIWYIDLPFEYTVDGKNPNEDSNENESPQYNKSDVLLLSEKIKEDRDYFLNDDFYNVTSENDDLSYLDKKIRSVPEGKHFIFTTDSHIDYELVGLSQKDSEIMAYVKSRLNSGFVVFGGDAIGQRNNVYAAEKVISVYAEDKFNAFGKDFLWCQGNHDCNGTDGQNKIPSTEVYKRTTKIMQRYGNAVFDSDVMTLIDSLDDSVISAAITKAGLSMTVAEARAEAKAYMQLHYYIDDKVSKIRFIVIETGDLSDGSLVCDFKGNGWELLMGYITFVADALQKAPDGYDVVVIMHQIAPYDSFTDGVTSMPSKAMGELYDLLAAFKNRGTSTITGDGALNSTNFPILNALMVSRIGDGKTYSFANRQTSARAFVLSGHFHFDDAWIIQNSQSSVWYYGGKEYAATDASEIISNAILHIQTDRACLDHKSDVAGTAKYPNAVTYPNNTEETRVGTVNEVLFDVVTITSNNEVVCTRFGGGNDRIFNIP